MQNSELKALKQLAEQFRKESVELRKALNKNPDKSVLEKTLKEREALHKRCVQAIEKLEGENQ